MADKKILVVVSSTAKYPNMDRATGLWLGEASHFVHEIEQNSDIKIDYCSPLGGYTPIDPMSLSMGGKEDWEWYQKRDFMNKLGATMKSSECNASDYSCIYYTGGHGTIFDFPDNAELQQIARSIYEAGGIVSSVCHGACALLKLKLSSGDLLIEGKKVTGFSDDEERAAELADHVPFLTEDELRKGGGVYQKADEPWAPFAVSDCKLITGQNPASAAEVAKLVLAELKK